MAKAPGLWCVYGVSVRSEQGHAHVAVRMVTHELAHAMHLMYKITQVCTLRLCLHAATALQITGKQRGYVQVVGHLVI